MPGIGHVGKLAADHMIDEFNATKFAEIYSPSFPPQVFVGEEGLIENMINELYYVKNVGEDNLDTLFLLETLKLYLLKVNMVYVRIY